MSANDGKTWYRRGVADGKLGNFDHAYQDITSSSKQMLVHPDDTALISS